MIAPIPPVKAVLFDLDGTLVDTLGNIRSAMNGVLEAHGMPLHDPKTYRRMVGWGVGRLVAQAIPPSAATPETLAALTAELMERYAQDPVLHVEPYPGIPELLAELRSRRIPTAVLTNKPHDLALVTVRRLFPEHRFERVQGDAPGIPRKPDPRGALAVCKALGVAPAEALFVGDSDVDVQTARNAGIPCAGAAWGFRGAQELREAGADWVVHGAAELQNAIRATWIPEAHP